MTQHMKWQQINGSGYANLEVSEMQDNKTVRMFFYHPQVYQSGFIDFNEKQLQEFRKWINVQLTKIKKKK